MTLRDWLAIQSEYQFKTLHAIQKARNAERQNALDCEKSRPACPSPDQLPPTKAEMAGYFELVWLGAERQS